jgi:3-oxoacyl-[acyl-carrier protein] reductase
VGGGRRTILVTGGASGIGLATACALADDGALVVVVDRKQPPADLVARDAIEAAEVDVSDASAVAGLVTDLEARVGIDGLVNAAGLLQLGTIAAVSETDWDRVVDVNLKGAYLMCRAVIPVLERRGGGAIVNLASIAGRTKSFYSAPNYVASKAGLIGLTMALAAQHAAGGIRVNCVAPGIVDTPMTSAYSEEQWASLVPTIPLGRIGTPSEVAQVIVSLLSDGWSYVTGQTINVNGGQFMQ